MMRQVRPYLAVVANHVANGFARRVGVELAGPERCLIPAGGMQKRRVMESGLALPLSRCALVLSGRLVQ